MGTHSSSTTNIAIIGAGKVGTSLNNALDAAGYNAHLVGKDLTAQLELTALSDIVLITAQDTHIEAVCEHIAQIIRPNTVVAHCSGALSCEPLNAAHEAGCLIGSAHPLNTFPNLTAAEKLFANPSHNTYCFISGDAQAKSTLQKIFTGIGFNTAFLDDKSKTAYHTACVFLCNYLTSLAELGLQTAENAGLERDEFWAAVQPLMQATLSNISTQGTAAALSGPIARGDINTIDTHLDGLQKSPALVQQAYRILGKQALKLAKSRNELSKQNLDDIKESLK